MIQFATQTFDLEEKISQLGVNTVLIASVVLITCTIIAALLKNHYPKLKLPLFVLMAGSLLISTAILFGSTVYLNVKSDSGGPVHWHAGVEFWACGTELNLRDPDGFLSNKIGSATYHEHNDNFIHLEGVVVDKTYDASIGKFLNVTGGYIRPGAMAIPINDDSGSWFASEDQQDGDTQGSLSADMLRSFTMQRGDVAVAEFTNGQNCGGQTAEVQAFALTADKDTKTYSQRKLDNPASHVITDEPTLGPPGDCVIVEFDTPKDRTDKLCQQYGVKDVQRCVEFGVPAYDPKLCAWTEVTTESAAIPPEDLPELCLDYLADPTLYRLSQEQAEACQTQGENQ